MKRTGILTALVSLFVASPAFGLGGASLKGSPASMVRQNQVAKANDFSFLRTASQVERFVAEGYLVPVESNGTLRVNGGVSYPVARPEMKLFLERLAKQYYAGCGEELVVTSLVRPTSEQPRNSHPLSVHPAGMAADLRISSTQSCRAWLESALLSLEEEELLDVTRERSPPHYHIALYPDRYTEYVQPILAQEAAEAAEQARRQAARLAMVSLEHSSNSLLATGTREAPSPESRRSDLALLFGVALVTATLGIKRLRTRTATDQS